MEMKTTDMLAEMKAVRLLLSALLKELEAVPGGLKATNAAKATAMKQAQIDAQTAQLNHAPADDPAHKVPFLIGSIAAGIKPI